jgi:TPR repeat protein
MARFQEAYRLSLGKSVQGKKEAFKIASEGVEAGCPHSKGVYASFFFNCQGKEKEQEQELAAKAIQLARESAAQGSPYGLFALGMFQHDGIYLKCDDDREPLGLWQLAAEQGHPEAQNLIAEEYQLGVFFTQDLNVAERLFRLSADQGLADAQYNLAVLLSRRRDSEEHAVEILRLLGLAIEQGHARAQCRLASHFHHGEFVKKDMVEAKRLYELAATQNDEIAIFSLKHLTKA